MKEKRTKHRYTEENPFFSSVGSFLVNQVIPMSVFSLLSLLLLCYQLVHAHSAEEGKPNHHNHSCQKSFPCGKLGNLGYPFTGQACPRQDLLTIFNCDGNDQPRIQLHAGGGKLGVEYISQSNIISIKDESLKHSRESRSCKYFQDLDLPKTPFLSFHVLDISLLILKCNHTSHDQLDLNLPRVNCSEASGYEYSFYYIYHYGEPIIAPPHCSIIHIPADRIPLEGNTSELFSLFLDRFNLQVQINEKCVSCHHLGGECKHDSKGRYHHCAKRGNDKLGLKLGLALGLGIGWASLIFAICILLCIRRRRNIHESAASENTSNGSSHHSSVADPEEGSIHNGVYIFSYGDLEKATNHFKESNEIRDGSFGASYYGKLEDGREVAVDRVCGYSYRRVEGLRNEVEKLSRLRHGNILSLYGCSWGYSRELLLVYEYISNGTLAHHLRSGFIPWHVRMSIAVQTARALLYLHQSNTIHTHLNTDNILLHHHFTVKLLAFQISRLFPIDVTHASTTPLGTPGYVDPEYLKCFQLTEKSDVYSFGVVLIELITSMPAFDTSRHIDEMSLANLAMNKIQQGTFGDIVDPRLGFHENDSTRNMIMSVAGLASRCLKQDREMRPDMVEVKQSLKMIQRGNYKLLVTLSS